MSHVIMSHVLCLMPHVTPVIFRRLPRFVSLSPPSPLSLPPAPTAWPEGVGGKEGERVGGQASGGSGRACMQARDAREANTRSIFDAHPSHAPPANPMLGFYFHPFSPPPPHPARPFIRSGLGGMRLNLRRAARRIQDEDGWCLLQMGRVCAGRAARLVCASKAHLMWCSTCMRQGKR